MDSKERRIKKAEEKLKRKNNEPCLVLWESTPEQLEELDKAGKPYIAIRWSCS